MFNSLIERDANKEIDTSSPVTENATEQPTAVETENDASKGDQYPTLESNTLKPNEKEDTPNKPPRRRWVFQIFNLYISLQHSTVNQDRNWFLDLNVKNQSSAVMKGDKNCLVVPQGNSFLQPSKIWSFWVVSRWYRKSSLWDLSLWVVPVTCLCEYVLVIWFLKLSYNNLLVCFVHVEQCLMELVTRKAT